MFEDQRHDLIVHVPSMHPDEEHPCWGNFMQAHIESAVATGYSHMTYYAYALQPQTTRDLPRQEFAQRTSQFNGATYDELRRRYKKRRGWQLVAMRDLLSWVSARHHRIRLLHAHGAVWGGVWCVIAGRRFGIPVLVSEHSSGFPRRSYPFFTRCLVRAALPHATALLPVTSNLGQYLRAFAPSVPQHVIPNCVNDSRFSPTPLPEPKSPLRILYVGSFVPVKRVDLLLKACARLRARQPLQLRLVGSGPLRLEMERLAAQLQFGNAISFAGHLPPEAVRGEMQNAHVIALSSEWESQPCVLIEAMLSGRPVVAPHVGGIPEMVNPDAGVLFPVGNEERLAKALEHVGASRETFNLRRTAEGTRLRHSFAHVGRRLDDLYRMYAKVGLESGPGGCRDAA